MTKSRADTMAAALHFGDVCR